MKKDLLDAYQARLLDYLDEADQARQRSYGAALAENAALAAGLLADPRRRVRAPAQRCRAAHVDRTFAALARSAAAGDDAAFERERRQAMRALDAFTAAPFTPEEQARRAAQLIRFLDLVPIEYDHGTDGEHVTIPFELQEALAFTDGAQSALNDLEAPLSDRDPAAVATIEHELARLEAYSRNAREGGEVVPLEQVEATHDRASDALDATLPSEWKETDAEADFDLVDISLDQMQAAVSAGEPEQAEQARLSRLRVLRVRPRAAASRPRPAAGLRHRGAGLVRSPRPRRARGADRPPAPRRRTSARPAWRSTRRSTRPAGWSARGRATAP